MRFVDNSVKGLETEVEVVVGGFYSDNSPRIDLVDANTREPWATCTVMLPGESTLMENVVYIKDWSENEGMRALLVKNNIIEKLPNGVTNGVYMHRLMPEVVRMVNDARASLEAEAVKPDFNDFNQAHRYSVPVKTKLILSLPITDFRPEAMRVTERMSANGTWFEVETFNATRNKWIDQKQHPTEAGAIADANGWYPQPTSGHIGIHDWVLGECCEDGIPVFVDDRQLAYRKTQEAATAYALEIIARLQADGDYRLNDKPAGFLPPPLAQQRAIADITPFDIGYFIRCEESNLGLLKSFGFEAGDYDHKRGGVMVEASESAMKMVADFPADFRVEGIVPESPEADAAPDGGDPSLKAQQENSPEI